MMPALSYFYSIEHIKFPDVRNSLLTNCFYADLPNWFSFAELGNEVLMFMYKNYIEAAKCWKGTNCIIQIGVGLPHPISSFQMCLIKSENKIALQLEMYPYTSFIILYGVVFGCARRKKKKMDI